MSEEVDAFMDGLNRAIMEALEEIGELILNDLIEICSVPVSVVGRSSKTGRFVSIRGPRGGRRIVRSKPGEPPRKETEEYVLSFRKEVYLDGDQITLEVYTKDPRGRWFTEGTTGRSAMLPRPHFEKVFDKWAPHIADRLVVGFR